MPLHIVIDDLGWFNCEDDRESGGPSRTGMPRRHVAEDYAAINRLGEALDITLDRKTTLSLGMSATVALKISLSQRENRLLSAV